MRGKGEGYIQTLKCKARIGVVGKGVAKIKIHFSLYSKKDGMRNILRGTRRFSDRIAFSSPGSTFHSFFNFKL